MKNRRAARRRELLRHRGAPRAAAESAKFYAKLPPKPTTPDRRAAISYHLAIYALLDEDAKLHPASASKLTRTERHNLQRLERRWRRRAAGEDGRFEVAGVRPGRLPRVLEDSYREPAHPDFADLEQEQD